MEKYGINSRRRLLARYNPPLKKAQICGIILVVIYAISVLLKVLIIGAAKAPSYYFDEFIYKENALYYFQRFAGEVTVDYNLQYPPLYSLVISLSFFFNNHFLAMKVINALIISAIVFPVYLLGRRYMSYGASLLLTMVIGLLPHQWIYPSFIISENLFLPLFVLCIYYATRPICDTKGKYFTELIISGIIAGLLFLTRYQGLIVIAILLPYYLSKMYYFEKEQAIKLLEKKWRFRVIMFYLLTVGLVVLAWALSDASIRIRMIREVMKIAGIVPTSGVLSYAETITGASFFQWTVWYVAYVVLALTPIIIYLILHAGGAWDYIKKREYKGFVLLAFFICGGLGFATVRHSYNMTYNQPRPQYMIGRYLSYIVVLLVIIGFILIKTGNAPSSRWKRIGSAIIALLAWFLSYYSLLGSLGHEKSKSFIHLFNGADILVFNRIPYVMAVVSIVLSALFMVNSYRFPKMAQLGAVSMCFLMLSGPVYIFRATTRQTSYLSIEEYQEMRKTGGNVDVFVYPEARLTNVKFTFDFWDTQGDAQRFNFVTQGNPNIDQIVSSVPLYTKDEAKLDTYYIYAHPLDSAHLSAEGADIVAEYGLQTQDYVALSMPVVPDSMIHSKGIHEGQAWVLTSGTSGTLVATIDGQECENSIVAKQDEFWLMTIDLLENAQTYDENSIIAIYDLRKHEYTTIIIGELYN